MNNNQFRILTSFKSTLTISCLAVFINVNSVFAFPVQVSNAPESDLALTVGAIQSAKKSLLLNVYELTSPEITQAIVDQIHAGIQVEILQEGQPVGGISAAGKTVQSKLLQAMQSESTNNHYFLMTAQSILSRRFHFDHAKYAVIDSEKILVGSENYSPTGNPEDHAVGNRGWAVFIDEPTLAQEFVTLFHQDADTSQGDLIEITGSTSLSKRPLIREDQTSTRIPAVAHHFENAPILVDASSAYKITSPNTSLAGIVALIDQSKTSIDIEQMTFDSGWGGAPSIKSPIFEAVVRAARRGVNIRVLLNDESAFDRSSGIQTMRASKSKNHPTVNALNDLAKNENLQISAAVADLQAMKVDYIHNKGMILDGNKTLISSINWNENAVEHNREAAVVLISTQAYDYYKALFDRDWNASHSKPDSILNKKQTDN